MTKPDPDPLEAFFAGSRVADPAPSDALMARVLADAAALQPATPQKSAVPVGLWRSFLRGIGGWPAMGGLAAASLTGLWIGMTPPALLDQLAANLLGTTATVSLWPDLDSATLGDLADG